MANEDFGRQNFAVEADTKKLKSQLADAERQFDGLAGKVEKDGQKMDAALMKVGKAAAGVFAFAQIQQFASAVVRARSEIEKYEVSFRTLLGSAEKGNKLFGQLRQFAFSTPLQLGTLAGAAQTMLGFNIKESEIMPMLRIIGDIAMGDAQKMQSLTLAFSQMSATGKLMGQDLLQMINAGFNPLAVISEKTGKSIGQLKKEMEAGAISSEMVADAFKSAASEGGKFFGMMEAQSKTIAGAMSNLQGTIEEALNALGTEAQPAIAGTIDLLTKLVKQYEIIGKVLTSLIATYGTYKAASLTATMLENAKAAGSLTKALVKLTAAQRVLNVVASLNPYVALAAAIVGVATAIYMFSDRTTEAEKATKRLQEREEAIEKTANDHREAVEKLMQVVADETKGETERATALVKLKKLDAEVFEPYDSYIELTNKRTEAEQRLTAAINERSNAQREDNDRQDREALEIYREYVKTHDRKNKDNLTYQGQVNARRTARNLLDAYARYHGLTEEQAKHVQLSDAERWGATLQANVNKANNRRSADAQNAYLGSLQSKSLDELKDEKKEMERLLNLAREQKKEYVSINGVLTSRKQLEERIAAIENLQKAERFTPAQFKAKEREAVVKAEKALKEFEKSKDTMDEATYLTKKAELEKNLEDAKKKYGSYDSENKNAEKAAQQEAELNRKRVEQARQYELDVREAAISGMEEGFEKEMAMLKLNYDKELFVIDQQKKSLADAARKVAQSKGGTPDYMNDDKYLTDAERLQLQGREAMARDKMIRSGITAVSGAYSTEREKKEREILKLSNDIKAIEQLIADITKSELDDKDKIVSNLQKELNLVKALRQEEESRARLEFGMQHGTTESRREAINEYYGNKVETAKANGDAYEVARLIAEQIEKLSALRSEGTQANTSNAIALSNADERVLRSREMQGLVAQALAQLKNAKDTGNLSATDLQTVEEAIERLTRGGLLQSLDALKTEVEQKKGELTNAQAERKSTAKTLSAAQREVRLAQESGDKERLSKATLNLINAEEAHKKAEEKVTVATDSYINAQNKAIKAADKTFTGAFKKGFEDFVNKYDKSKGGNPTQAALGDVGQMAGGTGQINEALDKMGLGSLGDATSALEGLSQGASAASKAMSGDFVGAAMDAFSMFGSFVDFFAGLSDNWEEMQDRIDLNTEALENLQWALDELREDMDSANSLTASAYANMSIANVKAQEWMLQNSIDATARMYKGASHSMQYYLDDDYSSLRSRIRMVSGFENFDYDKMWQYSADQWYRLRKNYLGLYTQLQNAISSVEEDYEGKVGKGLNDLLDQMTDLHGMIDEFSEQMKEKVVGISFDAFKDDYKAMLKEMGNASSSWRERMMQQTSDAVISRIADAQESALQDVYNRMATAIENNDTEALRSLTREAEILAQEAEKRINDLISSGVIEQWSLAFSEVYDDFESMLGNMESTSLDFFDNLQEKINTLFTQEIADNYREEMEKAQEKINEAIRKHDTAALEAAKAEYMDIVHRAQKEREELKREGLIRDLNESEGTATSRIASGITREDGAEINGRVTAIAMGQQRQISIFTSMQLVMQEQNENIREIASNTRRLAAIEEHLSEIDRNTKNL